MAKPVPTLIELISGFIFVGVGTTSLRYHIP